MRPAGLIIYYFAGRASQPATNLHVLLCMHLGSYSPSQGSAPPSLPQQGYDVRLRRHLQIQVYEQMCTHAKIMRKAIYKNKNKKLRKRKKKVPVGSTHSLIFICVGSHYRLGHPAAVEERLGTYAIGTLDSIERQRQAHVPRMTGASSGWMAPELVARRSAPSQYLQHPSIIGHDPVGSRCAGLSICIDVGPSYGSSVQYRQAQAQA